MARYGTVEEEVMLHETLSLQAKGLYGIIAIHCGDKHFSWPSISTMVKLSGASRATVCRLLKELKDSGCVTRFQDHERKITLTNKVHVKPEN